MYGHAGGGRQVSNLPFQTKMRVVVPSSLSARAISMSSDFPHYSFRMPNIGFQNLPLNIYIVVFGTAIFVFILSLLFCCYLIRSLSLCCEGLRLLVMEVTTPGAQRIICIQTGNTKGKGQRAKSA
ncbi:RING finger protein 24 isoform X4 [Takifugu flavidus]|uniref:RING finger protein 24 isoform X4 n=1 Tax=Takifugu flavidus TaxID=433684 RepID=UPI0025445C64|nr:RING finger protein 24 isoform X4 [Takifugu flavidus]